MAKIDIRFGALAPSLSEQIGHLIDDPKTMEHLDKDADAISRLNIRGIITDSEGRRARDRLFKQILAAVKASGKTAEPAATD